MPEAQARVSVRPCGHCQRGRSIRLGAACPPSSHCQPSPYIRLHSVCPPVAACGRLPAGLSGGTDREAAIDGPVSGGSRLGVERRPARTLGPSDRVTGEPAAPATDTGQRYADRAAGVAARPVTGPETSERDTDKGRPTGTGRMVTSRVGSKLLNSAESNEEEPLGRRDVKRMLQTRVVLIVAAILIGDYEVK